MKRMNRYYVGVILGAFLAMASTAGTATGLLAGLANHWSGAIVSALEAKGIISGDEFGRFDPDQPLTRSQLAKLFVVGLGFEENAQLLSRHPSRFADIPSWHWGKGYIEALAETGTVEGYPGGGYGPSDLVTRAQMAVFLVRANGLTEEARMWKFRVTRFQDDTAIPGWARGEVGLAVEKGLITGFPDGSFRPLEPVTRAEGAMALLRLLNLRGAGFHLTGTLVRFDPPSGMGMIRDELGQERSFRMIPGAQYFRGGVAVTAMAIRPLDEAWIVLGKDGLGRFLEARYQDMTAELIRIAGNEAVLTFKDNSLKVLPIQPGALAFLNGKPAPMAALSEKGPVYAVLDATRGSIRALDVIDAPLQAEFIGVITDGNRLAVRVAGASAEYPLAPDVLFFLNGSRVQAERLEPGDRIRLALNELGQVTYVQGER